MSRFDVDRMPVYLHARQLDAACARLAEQIGRKRMDLANQLARAASSVPVNISEGSGERCPAEKARFYRIARRSATECAGILDAVLDCRILSKADVTPLRLLASQVTAQLVLLAKAMEGRRK